MGKDPHSQKFILAIDQGTTGTTVVIIDSKARLRAKATCEFKQNFPQPGWVEHDPEDIWNSVVKAIAQALREARISSSQIASIGLANQRETSLLWERKSGKAVYPAIVWQDRRTAAFCESLKKAGREALFHKKTGLFLDPYFSGTKIRWILEHVRGLRARAQKGEIAFGTVDSFLLWKLSGGKVHKTDATNASRTLLMNLKTLEWDEKLCSILNVPMKILPEICPNVGVFGATRGAPNLPDGIPISAMAGDQQAALFGQRGFSKGDAKCTFGTGSFILLNTGETPVSSRWGNVSTVALYFNGRVSYALEGGAFICGAAVQWLRDGLKIIRSSSEIEKLASSVPDNGGVQFVPAFAGLGVPYWNPEVRGLICGLTRGVGRGHLALATLEAIALQNVDILRAMAKDIHGPIKTLRVDGGASSNNLLMQIQSDYSGVRLYRPENVETTALGAALMAGLGAGFWKSLEEIKKIRIQEKKFIPAMGRKKREERLEIWRQAIARAQK